MRRIHDHVQAIEHHASAIADLVTDNPDAALFTTNADVIPALERAFNLKPTIDAALAYAADQAHAGNRVGSSRTIDYLIKELQLSYPQAINRLRLGENNHGTITHPTPPDPPGPAPEPADTTPDPAEQQRRAEEEARQAAEEKHRREKAEQARAKAREQARRTRISQEKLTIIDQELRHLNKDARRSYHALYHAAIAQASTRLPHDLREWVRTQTIKANRSSRDPHAAFNKRFLQITDQDSDGGARFHGYAPADTLALLEAALAPANVTGHNLPDPGITDTRTLGQRRLDALSTILKNHSAEKVARTGIGTVVISMSAKDIDEMTDPTADHRYPTNTRAMLTPADILRLGAAKYNFTVVHDPDTGNPLHIGRTKRLATVEQRMALLATHLVCTEPDCTDPFCFCEIHHIQPWQYGGATDIDNLAGVCIRHHPDNRDQRDGQQARGHVAYDPDTGRRGKQPPPRPGNPHPAVEVNNTQRQEHSGGAKIRRQKWPEQHSDQGTTPTADAPHHQTPGAILQGTPVPDHTRIPGTSPHPQPPPQPTQAPSFDDMPPGQPPRQQPPPTMAPKPPPTEPPTRSPDHDQPHHGPPGQPALFPITPTG